MKDDAEFITSVLDRKDYRTLDATFGDNWMDVAEWRTEERCTDIVKCMYTKRTFDALLHTRCADVTSWKPIRSKVLFARARN